MKKFLFIATFFLVITALGFTTAHAQNLPTCGANCNLGYTPLEPIPGVTSGGALNFPTLLNNIYTVVITIGALFSVLMLTISGIRYMLSDVVTDKEKAKKRISACLWGLLLIAVSWLILHTINPQLTTFTLNPGTATVTAPAPNNTTSVPSTEGQQIADALNNKTPDSQSCNQLYNDYYSGFFNTSGLSRGAYNLWVGIKDGFYAAGGFSLSGPTAADAAQIANQTRADTLNALDTAERGYLSRCSQAGFYNTN